MKSEYISPHELNALMQGMHPANALAFELSMITGWRIGDVLSIKTSELCEEMTITEQKTGKKSKKRIPYALFCRLQAFSGEKWLFQGRNAEKHRTRQAVWADVRRSARRAGIEAHVSPHSARKVFAVNDCKVNGLSHTQRELNHRDSAVTALYAFSDTMIPDFKLDELACIIAEKVLDRIKNS